MRQNCYWQCNLVASIISYINIPWITVRNCTDANYSSQLIIYCISCDVCGHTKEQNSRPWSDRILKGGPHLWITIQYMSAMRKFKKFLYTVYQYRTSHIISTTLINSIYLQMKDRMHLATPHAFLSFSGKKSTNLVKKSTKVHTYLFPSSVTGRGPRPRLGKHGLIKQQANIANSAWKEQNSSLSKQSIHTCKQHFLADNLG